MFRRLPTTLPLDPVFPTDLEKLGCFINDKDQIRMIGHPEKRHIRIFHQRERVNDLGNDAYNAFMRKHVLERLHGLEMNTLRLPLGSLESEPHVPILTTPNLSTASRILVYFGDRNRDLGIFSNRIIHGEEGVAAGTAVNMVQAVRKGDGYPGSFSTAETATGTEESWNANPTAVVIANPGQLIWCRSKGKAMGRIEWECLPRESAIHAPFQLDENKNFIDGHRDVAGHVEHVFEDVIRQAGNKDVTIDIIAAEWTGAAIVRYLGMNWSKWSSKINGICLITPLHTGEDILAHSTDGAFPLFVSTRVRAYIMSSDPVGTLSDDPASGAEFGCNIYSSGEPNYNECIMTRAWSDMLAWFGRLAVEGKGAEEKWEMPELNGQESGSEIDEWANYEVIAKGDLLAGAVNGQS